MFKTKRKLILLDLDGTTLNSKGQITAKTKQVLRKIANSGSIISILTGRPSRLANYYYQQLGLHGPMICFNGGTGLIPDQNWAGQYQITFDRKIAENIIRHRNELGINLITVENNTQLMINHPATEKMNRATIGYFPSRVNHNQILGKNLLNFNPIYLTVQAGDHHLNQVSQYVNSHFNGKIKAAQWGGPHNVCEISAVNATKVNGIKQLAKYYHIDQNDTIAFGDQNNDREVLSWVGHGVAMRNGLPEVKRAADDVTRFDNDHDGMARYLENFFRLD